MSKTPQPNNMTPGRQLPETGTTPGSSQVPAGDVPGLPATLDSHFDDVVETGLWEAPDETTAEVAAGVVLPYAQTVPTFQAATPTFLLLLKALRRRWLWGTALGSLGTLIVGAAVWWLTPPGKHTAYAKLHMPATPKGVLFNHPEAGSDFVTFQKTQVALLKSRSVLRFALQNPRVIEVWPAVQSDRERVLAWLERQVKVEFPDGPELPRVVMTGDEPEKLAALVDAVVVAYFHEVINKQTILRQQHLDQLKEIAKGYKARLQKIQDERSELAKAIGASNEKVILLRQELVHKQLGLTQAELIKVDAELRKKKLEAKILRSQAGKPIEVPENVLDASIDNELAKDFESRERLQKQLLELRKHVNESHPDVRRLQEQLRLNQSKISDKRNKLRPAVAKKLMIKAKQDSDNRLVALEEEIKFSNEFRRVLNGELENLEKKTQTLNTRSLDIDAQKLELKQAEDGVLRVMGEIDKLTVELPAPPRVTLLEDVVVVPPEQTLRTAMLAGASGSGTFVLILLAIAFLEFRARRLDSPDEVRDGLGLKIIGTFPSVPPKARRLFYEDAPNATVWSNLLAESIDSVRTLVVAADAAKPPQILLVTSAVGGEGKTFLSTQLAASFARAGFKTLFVDGDLRRQGARSVLELPKGPGLSEALRGEVEGLACIHASRLFNLSLLPAGKVDIQAIQCLARDAVPRLLGQLKQHYEIIVIDSSPLLPVADTLQIAKHVDGVLISLFHKVSRLPLTYEAYQKLSMLNVRVLGTVITGSEEHSRSYYCYHTIHET